MSAGPRGEETRSGLTNRYQFCRTVGATHWFIWRGRVVAYQLLPCHTCPAIGDFGEVPGRITKAYHASDLSLPTVLTPLPAPASADEGTHTDSHGIEIN